MRPPLSRRSWILAAGAGLLSRAQPQDPEFVCPMDRDIRSKSPGVCPRCGMKLVAGLPEPLEYPLDFRAFPPSIPAGREVTLEFRVLDPRTGRPVTRFEVIHEKLFHLFLVSQDLEYFSHEHPTLRPDGWFRLRTRLPKPGTYRLLADFDPSGGTPQLSARTFSTAGWPRPSLPPSPTRRRISLPSAAPTSKSPSSSIPKFPSRAARPCSSSASTPAAGLEKFIGAWAHLLAVSNDLVDTIHSHPFLAEGGPEMQFNLFFPRAATYRLWLQLQRNGVVNTVAFTLHVQALH